MKLFSAKKIAVAGVAATVALGGAGVAFAYFTAATGTIAGTATVGTTGSWTVTTPNAPTGGPLVPGGAALRVPYTIRNVASGNSQLTGASVDIDDDGVDVKNSAGAVITGCKVVWFSVVNNGPDSGAAFPRVLTPNEGLGASSSITLNEAGVDQSSCANMTLGLTISATSATAPATTTTTAA